jgi:hypothetical protein
MWRWLQNYPHFLERVYWLTHRSWVWLDPVVRWMGYQRVDGWLRPLEAISKRAVFDCQMCGQCVLHSTGMTCPMTCPKNLRNGPCGGVRANGHCEVIPEMKCIWVEAYERSQQMPDFGQEMLLVQPPLNRQLDGSSAWINLLTQEDQKTPPGWISLQSIKIEK